MGVAMKSAKLSGVIGGNEWSPEECGRSVAMQAASRRTRRTRWARRIRAPGRRTLSPNALFFFADVVSYVRYLIRQVAYKEDMVYAPIRENDSNGDQLYSEMHTADWWWETQV